MKFFSRSKIKVDAEGGVKITGRFAQHAAKLESFIQELGVSGFSITLSGERFKFDGNLNAQHKQRFRNFLVNECPIRES